MLPRDKREVVLVLKNHYKQVCGMTGDGVNDAPALSAAQCGIAVDDATDAAKNAAAIILTSPGLSAIYRCARSSTSRSHITSMHDLTSPPPAWFHCHDSAVVESRRIFKKLKSYVTYRFAATIQIVCVLTLYILISNCSINSLFIILLALFNDLTLLPIAYDNQQAGSKPENPEVYKMLSVAASLGALQTVLSLIFAYGVIKKVKTTHRDYEMSDCNIKMQAILWVQMFIAAELLIFTTRASKYIVTSLRPSIALIVSVLGGCLLVSLMAGCSTDFGAVPVGDICIVWLYDVLGLLLCDVLKVALLDFFEENTEVLPELESSSPTAALKESEASVDVRKASTMSNNSVKDLMPDEQMDHRLDHIVGRLSLYADRSSVSRTNSKATDSNRMSLSAANHVGEGGRGGRASTGHRRQSFSYGLRDSLLAGDGSVHHVIGVPNVSGLHPNILEGTLRPRVPGNKKIH